jgi:hypothetical protein
MTVFNKSTTISAAKLALKATKEISNVFPPFEFVAAGLNVIVENAEVFMPIILSSSSRSRIKQLAGDNRKAINSLHARIGKLRNLLSGNYYDRCLLLPYLCFLEVPLTISLLLYHYYSRPLVVYLVLSRSKHLPCV